MPPSHPTNCTMHIFSTHIPIITHRHHRQPHSRCILDTKCSISSPPFFHPLIVFPRWSQTSCLITNRQQFKRTMRNRQMVEYLLYPKFFNAHSILYKGTYCLSFALYSLTKNKTTHAFPFLVTPPGLRFNPDAKEQPSLHNDGNFSFLSHKFDIVYEEERKRLDSQCIFRLEMDLHKDYKIFLRARLLRKSTAARPQEEAGLCVRKMVDYRFETIDEQLVEIKREDSLNHYQRIFFRASEFYSSVDLYLATFNYGYKYYRNKLQMADLLAGLDLSSCSAAAKMKEKCENTDRKVRSEEVAACKNELLQDFTICLLTYYYQLLKIIIEYSRLVNQYRSFARMLAQNQKDIKLPQVHFTDLDYIKLHDKVTVHTLAQHFQASSPEEIMANIFEQKELLRRHIRRAREEFCLLIPLQNERHFVEMVKKELDETEGDELKGFVRYVADLMPLQEAPQSQARNQAIAEFTRSRSLWNTRITSTPYFYLQSSGDQPPFRRPSLTVFVHGYQGNSFDFQKAKNYLRRHNKHTHVLIIQSITNDMNQSIDSLGAQAAEQVRAEINKKMYDFAHINFIGFSLGGLIARAAFARLQQFWPLFNLFVTFSSPHMGISQCDNSLINLGVWYLIKVDKVKNLKQLNFQSVKFSQSLLMRLSKCQGLSQFKKVVLVCSKNDGFVPYYSTVLDQRNCDKQELRQLCRNMTSQIKQIERVELVFDVGNSGTLDKLTGRKGHIEFLDNDYFLDIFFRMYGAAM